MIGVVDYGMGNLGSISNMISKMGGQSTIVHNAAELLTCDKVILPGVGSFDTAISNLKRQGLWDALFQFSLEEKKPLLGVCLGMQVLCKGSEEGNLPGLGWIDAEVIRFKFNEEPKGSRPLNIPHMGWNYVHPSDSAFPLFKNWEPEMRFYFVHSYAAKCNKQEESKGRTRYGYEFDSVIGRQNIMGMQCHPEKSHRFGMLVYKNFIDL